MIVKPRLTIPLCCVINVILDFLKVLYRTHCKLNFPIILVSNEATMSSHHQGDLSEHPHFTNQKPHVPMWFGLFLIVFLVTACGMLLDDPALYPDMEVAGEESDEMNANMDPEE